MLSNKNMNSEKQKKVWNNIAEEWDLFKNKQAKHILEFLKNKQGKILDLGSGSGRNLCKINNGKMYLLDFSEKMINLAKKRAKRKKISAEFNVSDISKENLPFPDNFFDAAICSAVFHCLKGEKTQEKATKELLRVLKPKAEAEISVWNKEAKRFKNSDKEKYIKWRNKGERYYYLFSPEEIYNLFEKIGFKITYKEKPDRNIVFIVRKP